MNKFLDETVVNEFMAKKKKHGDASVVCHEVVENEPNQFVDTFRSIDNIYDLVIMKKRQDVGLRFEQDMSLGLSLKSLE